MTATDFMTSAEFQQWLFAAEPGERATYHVGYLAVDREHQPALNQLADLAYEAQAGGFVKLTQLRLGDRIYVYLATRTEEIVG